MMNYYYLLKFNNYYNRLLKIRETIAEYSESLVINPFLANFNPNDEINTVTEAINIPDETEADYLVIADEYNNIVSRWFIIDRTRIRGNQWKFTLHRDVIADYYNIISQAPCFIEKSILSYDSPLLFNKEDMTFNQIKSKETLLKDGSGCAWLVGYYDPDAENLNGSAKNNSNSEISVVHVGTSVSDWWCYPYSNLADDPQIFGGPAINPVTAFIVSLKVYTGLSRHYLVEIFGDATFKRTHIDDFNLTFAQVQQNYGLVYGFSATDTLTTTFDNDLKAYLKLWKSIFTTELETNTLYAHSAAHLEHFLGFDGWVIGNNTETEIYQITIKHPNSPTSTIDDVKNTGIGAVILTLMDSFKAYYTDQTQLVCKYDYNGYRMDFKTRVDAFVRYDITGNTQRLITEDAPYNIFAMPFGDITIKHGNKEFINDSLIALNTASAMLANHGDFIYDIQLLPYCPYQNIVSDGQITLVSDAQYSLITQEVEGVTVNKSVIIYVPKSKVEFNINNSIPVGETAIERKINNECDKWRLASPNYSNFFDFSVEMNYGVDYFNVDCDFKPYTPYIHINPNFKSLYGADYNDPRGLICGGDFSITRVDNEWADYQIQNKNYSAIFDRQIQNMEVQHKAGQISDVAHAIAGTLQGAASGATAGGLLGGGYGAFAGSMLGGAGAAITGIADIRINNMLRSEALDYTKDLYAMQLGNIQALPQTISKVSSFNSNNKIFPVLEYYTATDAEKQALQNKIKYNGMTTMVIDSLANYLNVAGAYVKGKVIRLDDLDGDHHLANEISKEMNMGVFVEGELL